MTPSSHFWVHTPKTRRGGQTGACISTFAATFFTMAKRWEWPKHLLTGEWVKKTGYIHTMEYYPASERNEVLTHATTWVNLENMVSDIGRTGRGTCPLTPFAFGFVEQSSGRMAVRAAEQRDCTEEHGAVCLKMVKMLYFVSCGRGGEGQAWGLWTAESG